MRTLTKLIEATGHTLAIDLVRVPGATLGLPNTPRTRRLRRHRQSVIEIAAHHGARNVRVFGSVARGDDNADSDLDLLVDLDADVSLVRLAGLARELSELLGVRVDVVPGDSLKPGVRASVLAHATLL